MAVQSLLGFALTVPDLEAGRKFYTLFGLEPSSHARSLAFRFEGRAQDQVSLEAGYRNGWGFGRHVLGSNFFHYLRDPWMSMAEYFCDIDQIPGDGSWRAEDHPAEDALYRWGPPLPEDFDRNFEPE